MGDLTIFERHLLRDAVRRGLEEQQLCGWCPDCETTLYFDPDTAVDDHEADRVIERVQAAGFRFVRDK